MAAVRIALSAVYRPSLMLSTVLLVMTITGPLHEGHIPIPKPYTVGARKGDVLPPTKPKGYPF
jgi:hypothetical protein